MRQHSAAAWHHMAMRLCIASIAVAVTSTTGCALLIPHPLPDKLSADNPIVVSCAAVVGVDPEMVATEKPKNKKDPQDSDAPKTPASQKTDVAKKEHQESQQRAMDGAGGVDWQHVGLEICSGIERAEGYHDAYFDAARWNSGFRNTAAAVGIPLVGLTVREGLKTSPSQNKIAAFAVASVILYGWSTQLTSQPRETAYFNGMQAMSCAIVEAQPVVVGVGELQLLGSKSKEVVEARKTLRSELAKAGEASLTKPEDAVYVKALADADNAIGRTGQFAIDLAKTAGQFLPLVEILAAEVDKNITATEPSSQSFLTLINGFAAQTTAITQAAVPSKAGTTGDAAVANASSVAKAQGGVDVPDAVKAALKTLVDKTAELDDLLSRVIAVADVASNVKSCKPAGITSDFKVEPGDATAVVQVGKSLNFTIANSISVPSAQVQGDNADSIKVNDITVKDGKFTLKVDGVKATGDSGPTLVVTDGTGQQQKRITVNVTAAQSDTTKVAPKKDNPKPPSAALTQPERMTLLNAALVPEGANDDATVKGAVSLLQCVVGTKVDGAVGAATRTAIKSFRQSTPTGNADVIDEPLMGDIRKALGDTKKDCKKPP
jgi:hypothetical protein